MAKKDDAPKDPEQKKDAEQQDVPTPSPIQLRRLPVIRAGAPRVSIETHTHTAKMPALLDFLSFWMLAILFFVSAVVAMDNTASMLVSVAGNISFACMIATGALAIQKVVTNDAERGMVRKAQQGDIPPEIQKFINAMENEL